MAPYKETTRSRRPWPWWRWVLTGLSILALALSAYLSWHDLMGGTVIGCGVGSSCDQVLNSRWSSIGGVFPVSGLAAGVYLAMLVSSLFIGPATEAPVRRLAWGAMLVIVGSAAGSAVWFTIVQKWFIGAFCFHCMATHITGLLLAALVIWKAPRPWKSSDVVRSRNSFRKTLDGNRDEPRSRLTIIVPVLIGLTLAGILAACQVFITPPAIYIHGESQDNLSAVDPNAVPMIGSPDALHIVTLLFDYKCPHCQKLYFMLDEVIRRYDGKLAFALRPAPLDSQCNPYIPRTVEQYKDSCELVKIGLAVWVAEPEAFPTFERWMFSFESGDRWRPRSLDAAKAKAVELVGQAKFDAARAVPWIDRYLQASIRIYGQTIQTGKGGIPKLVFGSRWVIPEPYSADGLISILHNSLAVPMP